MSSKTFIPLAVAVTYMTIFLLWPLNAINVIIFLVTALACLCTLVVTNAASRRIRRDFELPKKRHQMAINVFIL
jgi:Flp pilus assembly protein TadB